MVPPEIYFINREAAYMLLPCITMLLAVIIIKPIRFYFKSGFY